MDWLSNPDTWIGLATLTLLEIGLGIDNIVFNLHSGRQAPETQQAVRPSRAGW